MNTIQKFLTAISKLVPAYLRPDRSPEGKKQQDVAASTSSHG